jgi:2-keto-4-pentenoate hydratase/2-oxohepta-3-ene-1,7-dioic acid hydratase in catechol pathway
MKIARIDHEGAPTTAVIEEESARLLPGVSVLDMLAAEPDERDRLASRAAAEIALTDARLLAPVAPAAFRDFSVFERHIEGAMMNIAGPDAKIPEGWAERPGFFFSSPNGWSGHGDEIAVPPGCELLDLELEVAVVIGRSGRNIRVADANAHIAGYTVLNDWTARDIAAREFKLPFGLHKAKDFAYTLGPWIVTPDELEPYRSGDRLDLAMKASINGQPLGDGDTLASMAWSFEELVAFSAHGSSIAAGDVIGSGTCGNGCLSELWGRAQRREPPPLQPGDEVTLEVQGIGTLSNTVVRGDVEPIDFPAARRVGA